MIIRNELGQFTKGNAYWLGRSGKKPNSGSFPKGLVPWNKDKRTYKLCERCGKQFTTNHGKLTKPKQRFCSMSCSSWRNGNSSLKKKLWVSKEAVQWRKSIKERDKVCVFCGTDKNLHCDHIKPQKHYPELMFEISNGRLLCFDCHKQTPTYGHRNAN